LSTNTATRTQKLFRVAFRWIAGHLTHVLLAASVLTALSVWAIVARFDIRSDIKDLMPSEARSVRDTFTIADRMGSITSLSIIIESPSRTLNPTIKESDVYKRCITRQQARDDRSEAAKERGKILERRPAIKDCDDPLVLFAGELEIRLAEIESVGYVHYHNDKNFFEDNILLYASNDALERLYTDIDEKLTDARKQSGEYKACLLTAVDSADCESIRPGRKKATPAPDSPATDQTGDELAADESDYSIKALSERYGGKGGKDSEIAFTAEYDVNRTADGSWFLTMLVRFRDASTSLKETEKHLKEIEALVASMEPSTYAEDLIVAYGGGFKTQQGEAQSVVRDVQVSGGTTVGGIMLLLLIFFRRIRAAFVIFIPLLMSIAWTLAIAFLTVGYLNLITAFIFAILLGLGIDFGIHILARFDEERSKGKDAVDAMEESIVEVGSSNFAGALTTAATFFTLLTADFRGFSQFGLVAGIGVMVSLFAMLTVAPAFVLWFHKVWPAKTRVMKGAKVISSTKVRWLRPLALLVFLALATVTGLSLTQVDEIQFEENFYRLRMKESEWKAEENRYRITNREKRRHSSPAIILLDSLEEVSALEKRIQARKDPGAVESMQLMLRRFPRLMNILVQKFSPAIIEGPEYAVAPAMVAAARTLPDSLANLVPRYSRFDRAGTEAQTLLRAFVGDYPGFSGVLGETLRKPLRHLERYRPLGLVSHLAKVTPAWMHEAIPTRRVSNRLSSVTSMVSIYSFMPGTPAEQAQKLALIEKLQKRTERRNIRFLPQEDQDQINALRTYLVKKPVSVDDLPGWVKMQFKESGVNPAPPRVGSGVDYAFGNIALVYQNTSTLNGIQAHRFTQEMRSVRVEGKELTMSTNAFVFSDMLTQIQTDGLDVSFLAFGIVFLVVLLQHRSLMQTLVIMAPLAIALAWIVGIMSLLDMKLGLFNMVILPVIIGIGIDNGIHLFHRYRTSGRGGTLHALRFTGGSIFMTSATTIMGFGGMMLSMHMGLNTMGQLSVAGIFCCWLATMTIQPTLFILAEWLNIKSIVPDHDYEA